MSLNRQDSTFASVVPRDAAGNREAIVLVEGNVVTPLGPRIVFANHAACEITGYDLKSLTGSSLGLIYDHKDLDRLNRMLPKIATRTNYVWMDQDLVRNGGEKIPCRWTIRSTTKFNGKSGQYFTLTLSVETPLPESKEPASSQKAVARNRVAGPISQQEKETDRTHSVVMAAGGVAHDFKNALQIIKTNLELAGLEGGPFKNDAEPFLNEAAWALGDAELLARQMLAISKEDETPKEVFQVNRLVQRVSRLGSAGSKVRCYKTIPDDVRCVYGRPTDIYRVLHNLVTNARQAMPGGGAIHLETKNADLEAGNPYQMPRGRYTLISVRDRGCGIPRHLLPKIFEPSFTTKSDGNGLGLACCLETIESHGGTIRVRSNVGIGTEFVVFLPSTEKEEEPEAVPDVVTASRSTVALARDLEGLRVLIVEDDPRVAKATGGILKYAGFSSVHASSGEEAVTMFREHQDSHEPIDVALIDMTLPNGLDGREVLSELQKFDPDLRAVATSGYFEGEGEAEVLSCGFKSTLPKPYAMEELSRSIEEALFN